MSNSFSFPQQDAPRPEAVSSNPLVGKPASASGMPANPSERRRKRRALISAPVRVRGVDLKSDAPDEISTTVDVSRTGVLFVTTNQAFHRGMEVAVTFPYTKSPAVPQSEQPGSVVRVSALSHGQVAVAIAFGFGMGQRAVGNVTATPDLATAAIFSDSPAAEESAKPLILAVESNAAVRDSLKAYLSGEGYKVIAVETSSDAREVLNLLTPALLIAEIEGEGLPGYDLCVHVKATPRLKHIPVLLTTGSAYPSDYSAAHSLGAVVCMAKPYRQERLGHVVRLLVAPAGASSNAEPPRAPDRSRRFKAPGGPRRGNMGRLFFC